MMSIVLKPPMLQIRINETESNCWHLSLCVLGSLK